MNTTLQTKTVVFYQRLINLLFGNFFRASMWLSAASIVAGILGYVFQIVMGRMLNIQDYALFSAIMALFMMAATPLSALLMIVSRQVSAYRAKQDVGSIRHFYYSISVRMILLALVLLSTCYFITPYIQASLKSSNAIPVFLLGALLFFTLPMTINNGFLQGLQNFTWFSNTVVLNVLFKILLAALLVRMGFGLIGALFGVVLSSLIGWIVSYAPLHCMLKQGCGKTFQTVHIKLKPCIPVLIANIAFAAMTQLDIVFVNYYFPAHEAGLYAAASVLGKAVMYLPGGIAMAMFPTVAEHYAKDEGSIHLLLQAVGLTILLCGVGAVFYFFFSNRILELFYGSNYLEAGEVLKYYGFAIFPMALVMVAEYFLIAKGKVLFAYLFAGVMPLQLLAIYCWHSSLLGIVLIIGLSSLMLASLGYGLLWRSFRKNINDET